LIKPLSIAVPKKALRQDRNAPESSVEAAGNLAAFPWAGWIMMAP
jgi:hypothetical protein